MKTLYFDCGMGAAGDMLAAALLELIPDQDGFLEELNHAGIPGVCVEKHMVRRCGIIGTQVVVKICGEEEGTSHSHHSRQTSHRALKDIEGIVDSLRLDEKVKEDVMKVYGLLADAESHAHGVPVTEIHFHEIGTLDAITDIATVCWLMNKISPHRVVVSPINVGSGQIRCHHGILPVPAPATTYLLRNMPMFSGKIEGELCTPTGAALLKYFATEFGLMPIMKVDKVGYGMGKNDYPAVNCIRSFVGEEEIEHQEVIELSCNLDDATPENIGFAMELLMEAGALDVYSIPIGMKKGRPGILLSVICEKENRERMVYLLFKHTTTLGIRENRNKRYTLSREVQTVKTVYGNVRKKVSTGYNVQKSKYEHEDIASIAREKNMSILDVVDQIDKNLT